MRYAYKTVIIRVCICCLLTASVITGYAGEKYTQIKSLDLSTGDTLTYRISTFAGWNLQSKKRTVSDCSGPTPDTESVPMFLFQEGTPETANMTTSEINAVNSALSLLASTRNSLMSDLISLKDNIVKSREIAFKVKSESTTERIHESKQGLWWVKGELLKVETGKKK